MQKQYENLVIGIDYGTDSVRALLVDVATGTEIATSVFEYPRWKKGLYCNPSEQIFRQHPLDYLEGLEYVVKNILQQNDSYRVAVKAISVDTTGSTPVAVDENSIPLSLHTDFEHHPNAMFILWKDHSAIAEADEINRICKTQSKIDYTKYSGGVYSSEWFWSKVLHVIREDSAVRDAAFSWVEHCDWIPAMLTGVKNPIEIKRSRCAAGHKALWNSEWGGFPGSEFFSAIDERLLEYTDTISRETITADKAVGFLSPVWAAKLGLTTTVMVGCGAFDAHFGAVGGEIGPYTLSKVMGTSTCDMMVVPPKEMYGIFVSGISGQVDGSIIPDMIGLEAGQSAFGDIYAWYKKIIMWPLQHYLQRNGKYNKELEAIYNEIAGSVLFELSQFDDKTKNTPLALDWMNGRRTPNGNQKLEGGLIGIRLGTEAPDLFRALVEATAYGSKAIVNCMREQGVKIDQIVALGGVAKKSPYVMQVMADVLNMPIKVVRSEQTCALGAAMFAAVVGGFFNSVMGAQKQFGKGFEMEYCPSKDSVDYYSERYEQYKKYGKLVESNFY